MITKEQIQLIYDKMDKLQANDKQIQDEIKIIEQSLKPMKKIQDRIQMLQQQNRAKAATYTKNLFWILNTHINSQGMLSLGHIQKGQNMQNGRVGSVIKKLLKILGLASNIPRIGDACDIIKSIAEFYVDDSEDVMIAKMGRDFSAMWNQGIISNAISQIIIRIIDDNEYGSVIEEGKQLENLSSLKFYVKEVFIIIGQMEEQVIGNLQGLPQLNSSLEEMFNIADCSFDYEIGSIKQKIEADFSKIKKQLKFYRDFAGKVNKDQKVQSQINNAEQQKNNSRKYKECWKIM